MAITIASNLDYDQASWEALAYFALRPELYFRAIADVKPTAQTHNGSSVIFTIQSDIALQSTAINESTDVTPVSLSDSQITVTLAEYGQAVQTTALVRGTSFLPLDPIVANVVGFAAGASVDTIVRDVCAGGTNVRYALGTGAAPLGRTSVTPLNTFGGADARRALADLRGNNVPTVGGMYVGFIHPDVSYDFRGQTGGANWRDPHVYSQPGEIWNGEIGAFEGIRWIETPRAKVFADAGSSTTLTDVYATTIHGRQSLAEAYSNADGNGSMPRIAPTPVTDQLRRFTGMGWYFLAGWSIFRQACVRRVESSSSIGTNT